MPEIDDSRPPGKDSAAQRFSEPPTWLSDFQGRIRARCPGCAGSGVVVRGGARTRFVCRGCAKVVDGASWFGPMIGVAARPCGGCGRRLLERRHSDRGPGPASLRLRCECGHESAADLSWSRHWTGPIEPSFGLSLALVTEVRGHTLWVWNLDHLAFLERYVGAELRERSAGHNSSLASRLPGWMSAAKNREAVLRGLAKLRAMAEG